MSANWLLAQVRRTARNRIILAALLVLGALAVLIGNRAYLKEYFQGPAYLSAGELERAGSLDALDRRWIRVEAVAVEDTGVTEITVRTKRGVERGRSVTASYHAALLGSRILVVKHAAEGSPGTLLTGELRPLEGKLAEALFKDGAGAAMRPMFMPMQLEATDYRASGHWILLGVIATLAVAAWLVLTSRGWLAAPHTHPALRRASAWGDLRALDAAVAEDRLGALNLAGWELGRRFLVRSSLLGLELHRLDELLWAYGEVTKKKLYYVIPAGQTQALVLRWRDRTVRIDCKEAVMLGALEQVVAGQPWIMVGWSKDAETFYDRQRGRFAAEVAKARQQWQQSQAPAPVPSPAPAAAAPTPVPVATGFEPTQPQPI